MLRSQLQTLFDLMDENEYRSAGYFAQRLGVSLKTVRNYMKELTSALRNNGADVISKPRFGYRLVIKDADRFSAFLKESQAQIPKTSSERNLYLLTFLLSNDGFIKIDDLCSLLYISRSSISGSIHLVEKVLNQYNISLERKPGYGLRAVGDEFDIRRLICYTQLKHRVLPDLDNDFSYLEDDLLWSGKVIMELLTRFDIHLTEVAFDNFVNYVYVGLQRLIGRKELHFHTQTFPVPGIKEQMFTDALVTEFNARYGVEYTEDEKKYILLYLSGKQAAGYTMRSDDNFVISEEINTLSLEILEFIDREFHTSFSSNMELRMALNQHLTPLEIRLRYGLPLTNPLVEQTKTQYPLAYDMAIHAATLLSQHYQRDLSEYETAYLALIFALQLAKAPSTVDHRLNILIVSNANTSALNLLKYQYEHRLSNRIDKVYFCDLIGLRHFDFEQVDYIFSTVPIPIEVPVPIFEISLLQEALDTHHIEEAISRAQSDGLHTCFSYRRFIGRLQAGTKEEALDQLCQLVMEQEEVDPDFFELVMKREKGPHVQYGTGIAIPHPETIASNQTFAYAAVLEQTIDWDGEAIQVILLSSPGRQDPGIRQTFYECAARLVLDPGACMSLVENPTYENFISLLDK